MTATTISMRRLCADADAIDARAEALAQHAHLRRAAGSAREDRRRPIDAREPREHERGEVAQHDREDRAEREQRPPSRDLAHHVRREIEAERRADDPLPDLAARRHCVHVDIPRRAATRARTSGPSIHGIGVSDPAANPPAPRRRWRGRRNQRRGRPAVHLPMQKREKMTPSRSSDENSPVIVASAACASRKSSAKSSSGGRAAARCCAAAREASLRLAQGAEMALAGKERPLHVFAARRPPRALRAAARRPRRPSLPKARRGVACDRHPRRRRDDCTSPFRARRDEIGLVVNDDTRQAPWAIARGSRRPRRAMRRPRRARRPPPAQDRRAATAVHVRSMPIVSIGSSVARSPAVSTIVSGMPRDLDLRARPVSRVVPAIGVTIATSSPARRFSRLDLPTFGRPTSTTASPSRSSAPCAARASICARRARMRVELAARVGGAQEIDILVRKVERRLREHPQLDQRVDERVRSSRENSPDRLRAAARAAVEVAASIRSATLSACARSSLPFRNARCVNSPGSREASAQFDAAREHKPQHRRARRARAVRSTASPV